MREKENLSQIDVIVVNTDGEESEQHKDDEIAPRSVDGQAFVETPENKSTDLEKKPNEPIKRR